MDILDKYKKREERLDEKMIALFENRMGLVKKAARYKRRRGIKADRNKVDISDIVTNFSCDIEAIEYTEGLIMYIHAVSNRLERKILKKK